MVASLGQDRVRSKQIAERFEFSRRRLNLTSGLEQLAAAFGGQGSLRGLELSERNPMKSACEPSFGALNGKIGRLAYLDAV